MKLLIAIPTYNNYIHSNFSLSLINLISYCCKENIQFIIKYRQGSLINRVRNEFITDFLKGDFTHILMLDSDLFGFEKMIVEMIEYVIIKKKLLVGGIYIKKSNKEDYNCNLLNCIEETLQEEFPEVKHIPTGLMLINKQVIYDLIQHYPNRRYTDYENKNIYYNFFDSYIKNDYYLSEDYGFCELYKEIGGKIHAHIDGVIFHNGNIDYSGNFKEFLQNKIS